MKYLDTQMYDKCLTIILKKDICEYQFITGIELCFYLVLQVSISCGLHQLNVYIKQYIKPDIFERSSIIYKK